METKVCVATDSDTNASARSHAIQAFRLLNESTAAQVHSPSPLYFVCKAARPNFSNDYKRNYTIQLIIVAALHLQLLKKFIS